MKPIDEKSLAKAINFIDSLPLEEKTPDGHLKIPHLAIDKLSKR